MRALWRRGELTQGTRPRAHRGLRLLLDHTEVTLLVGVELSQRDPTLPDESHQGVLMATTLTGSVTKDGVAGAGARGELLLLLGAGVLVASALVGYAVRARGLELQSMRAGRWGPLGWSWQAGQSTRHFPSCCSCTGPGRKQVQPLTGKFRFPTALGFSQ